MDGIKQAREFILDSSGFFSFGGGGSPIGLNISSSNIKLCEIKKTGKQWKLIKFSIANIPEEAIVNREIVNPIILSDTIKNLSTQAKLSSKNICTALGGSSLIIKRMTVEVAKPSDIQDAVFREAEQYLPFDASEVSMDYHQLSRGKDGKTDVIFVAAKLSILDTYTQVIESGGLKAKILDSEFFSLQNVFEANYPQVPGQAVAIVDIGASSIKVMVLQEGIPIYTKEAALGGRNLTSEIQKQLNLSFADAEALKVGSTAGNLPQEISELMHTMCDTFGVEIKRALDFYSASSSGAPVASIFLTGGSTKIPEILKVVEEKCAIPVQFLNPFAQIGYDEKVFTPDYIQSIAPFVAVPLGLAIRGANE